MTHEDAVNGMAVERYLLGELAGGAREQFEDHLFDCRVCAADVKDGVLLLDTARTELRAPSRSGVAVAEAKIRKPAGRVLAWPWQGWALGPALAACLAVIVYQSAVMLPKMRTELAMSAPTDAPAVLTPLVLANAGARGGVAGEGSLPEIAAPRHGFYLLSVDIPPAPEVVVYRCTLISPAGDAVWSLDVPPQQARDTVTIQVPVTTAKAGINELRVEGVPAAKGPADRSTELAKYRYKLSIAK